MQRGSPDRLERVVRGAAWAAYFAIIVATLDFTVPIGTVMEIWHTWRPKSSGDLASWVQAIGTVVAIFASAAFVLVQHWLQGDRERQERTEQDARLHEAVFQLATGATQSVRKAAKVLDGVSTTDVHAARSELDTLAGALRRINPSALGEYRVIEPVSSTASICAASVLDIDRLLATPGWASMDRLYLRQEFEHRAKDLAVFALRLQVVADEKLKAAGFTAPMNSGTDLF